MNKKILSALIIAILLFAMPLTAFAAGFDEEGNFSNTEVAFGFTTSESVLVHNNTAEVDPYYDEVYAGSDIYVPIYVWDRTGTRHATDKEIKEHDVQVSYKTTLGGQYIESVSIVDGKKSKINEIPAGAYALIQFTDTFQHTGYSQLNFKLVLSVNKVTDQSTEVNFKSKLSNWEERIRKNSVYGVLQPTVFRASDYSGEVTFDFGKNIRYITEISSGERYYLSLKKDPNTAITNMYPKTHMEFLNFTTDGGSFSSVGELEIPIDRAKFKDKQSGKTQVFIYEIVNDTLKALDEKQLSFDGPRNILTLKTQVLGEYVISAQPLMKKVETEDEDDIIYTGYASPAATPAAAAANNAPAPTTNTGAANAAPPTDTVPAVPPVQDYPNENVNTGLSVYVENSGTGNPATSDNSFPILAAIGMLAGGLMLCYYKKIKKLERIH